MDMYAKMEGHDQKAYCLTNDAKFRDYNKAVKLRAFLAHPPA
jgi:hypothetical protein